MSVRTKDTLGTVHETKVSGGRQDFCGFYLRDYPTERNTFTLHYIYERAKNSVILHINPISNQIKNIYMGCYTYAMSYMSTEQC